MNFETVLKFIIRDKKKLLVSLLSMIFTGFSCFFYFLGTAAMGSGLSNTADKSTISYWLGENFLILFAAMIVIVPITNIIGLVLYWRLDKAQTAHFLMFSSIYTIILYFLLASIIGLLYMIISSLL